MTDIPDESVQLVLTSPPYPMIEMWDDAFSAWNPLVSVALKEGDSAAAYEEMHRCLDSVWTECSRILSPGGIACINIGDATRTAGGSFRLYPNHSRITAAFEARGFHTLPCIIWRKQTNSPTKFMGSGMLPAGAYVTLEHEYILVFRKGGKRSFSGEEVRKRRESAFFWEERNLWFSDLWEFKGTRQLMNHTGRRDRSAAYPLELAHRLVNMYSVRGDTVVDPFLGTGTTLIGCLMNARRCAGYEIDPGLKPVIEDLVIRARSGLNGLIAQRYADHLKFIGDYRNRKGDPKHHNSFHGFEVITKQETDLVLASIQEISLGPDNTILAAYEPYVHKSGQGELMFY
ncbi:MAG: site-specific DNA-methyltransferase [Spirochaetales bacterium]|nr:site-specific DNA-methyltransferase [Spirochaetales bacterium]